MKQVKGHLFVLPIQAMKTSALVKTHHAYTIRAMVSGLLGRTEVLENWVKVRASDEIHPDSQLWDAWYDNYKAVNSLLHEHNEIMNRMNRHNFSPDSERMDKLITQFEETTKSLESRFEEQNAIADALGESKDTEGTEKSIDWHRQGFNIEGKISNTPFPEELPSDIFEGKKKDDLITFTYGDIEFTFTIKQVLEDEGEGIPLEFGIFPSLPRKPSMPVPIKIALGIIGGLGILLLGRRIIGKA